MKSKTKQATVETIEPVEETIDAVDETIEASDSVPVSKAIQKSSIPRTIASRILETCREMTGAWHTLSNEERERIEGFADYHTQVIAETIAKTLAPMIDDFLASGRGYFSGTEKGIAIKDGVVTLTLTTDRRDVPEELYTHRGRFLVIIADDVASLEELNRQADLFDDDEPLEPPVAVADPQDAIVQTFLASGATLEGWAQDFIEHMQDGGCADDFVALYFPGGTLEGLLADYHRYGWSAYAAAANEMSGRERLIVDGQPT